MAYKRRPRRGGVSRKSDFLTSLCPLSHGTLTSRASRGGHSLPGPPRDARDATRTAATAPSDTSDGRNRPERHLGLPQPPRATTRTAAPPRATPSVGRPVGGPEAVLLDLAGGGAGE